LDSIPGSITEGFGQVAAVSIAFFSFQPVPVLMILGSIAQSGLRQN